MPPLQANNFAAMAIVAAAVCAVIVADMLVPLRRSRITSGVVALLGSLIALGVLLADLAGAQLECAAFTGSGMLVHDLVSNFLSVVFLFGVVTVILFSIRSSEISAYRQGEYYALLLGAVLGAMLLVSSGHVVLFILGLETLSISSYVLAGYLKHDRHSAEASLKYLVYGAVVSAVLFFAVSYLYGITGTLHVREIGVRLAELARAGDIDPVLLLLIIAMTVGGLGFKIALVPFHFWCPDVYQGAPTPITALLAVVSKAAGFGALLRLCMPFYSTLGAHWDFPSGSGVLILFGMLSLVTMTFGNLAALRQTNVKRLLAYSSIAHAGYLLMPLSTSRPDAVDSILFYFFVYLFMNLGVFWVIIVLVNATGSAEMRRFRGVAYKAPFLFATLFLFLIALTGLPPTAGFVGKFMLFKVVVSAGITHLADGQMTLASGCYFFLALAGVLNSAISLYYYMKFARSMAFEKPDDEAPLGEPWPDRALAGALAAPTLLLLYFPPVLGLIAAAGL